MFKTQDTKEEQWKLIEGFEDYYQVSSLGRIQTCHSDKRDWELDVFSEPFDFSVWQYSDVLLTRGVDGHLVVKLVVWGNNRKVLRRVIDLVAMAFVPNNTGRFAQPITINGDETDLRACNVKWV